jgi:hypothetical protein
MSARRVLDSAGGRRADLAAIHIAAGQLKWSDDEYRDVMHAVCGVRSSALLDFAGRKRFLEHLRKCQAGAAGEKPKRAPWNAQQRQVWALWQRLADDNLVTDRTRPGLEVWLERYVGVRKVDWLRGPQLDQALAMLRSWSKRGGA